jgi:hypothetical protein
MNRQHRRALKKQTSTPAEQKMAEQVAKFGKMPQQCSACTKEFDKKDRSMIESWSVVVKQEVVRLFCPACINKTKEALSGSHTNIK